MSIYESKNEVLAPNSMTRLSKLVRMMKTGEALEGNDRDRGRLFLHDTQRAKEIGKDPKIKTGAWNPEFSI